MPNKSFVEGQSSLKPKSSWKWKIKNSVFILFLWRKKTKTQFSVFHESAHAQLVFSLLTNLAIYRISLSSIRFCWTEIMNKSVCFVIWPTERLIRWSDCRTDRAPPLLRLIRTVDDDTNVYVLYNAIENSMMLPIQHRVRVCCCCFRLDLTANQQWKKSVCIRTRRFSCSKILDFWIDFSPSKYFVEVF